MVLLSSSFCDISDLVINIEGGFIVSRFCSCLLNEYLNSNYWTWEKFYGSCWVFTCYATLYFYSITFMKEILYILTHPVCHDSLFFVSFPVLFWSPCISCPLLSCTSCPCDCLPCQWLFHSLHLPSATPVPLIVTCFCIEPFASVKRVFVIYLEFCPVPPRMSSCLSESVTLPHLSES